MPQQPRECRRASHTRHAGGALDTHSAALTGAARVRQYIHSLAPTDPRLSRGCRPSLRHATASADTGTLPSTCLRPQATFRDQCSNSPGESLRVHAAVATAYTQLGPLTTRVTLPDCSMQLDSVVDRFVCRGMQRMHNPPDHHGHASRASTPDTCHSSGARPSHSCRLLQTVAIATCGATRRQQPGRPLT